MSPKSQRSSTSTKSKQKRLSQVARHVCVPKGIVTHRFNRVEQRLAKIGITFDEWQRGLGKLILGERADGSFAAGVGGAVMSIPRQTGKTYLVGWLIFARCLLEKDLFVLWTAHRTRTSDETFKTMAGLAVHPKVNPYLKGRPRQANGQQAIEFANGSRILFGAREQGFGRGFQEVDLIVFDEAQILTDSALDDMVPAANASDNGLVLYMGTPPRPKDPGEVFKRLKADALAGDADTLYVEFSADDDCKPESWGKSPDWEQIAKANPSYPHRTGRRSILRMMKQLKNVDSFRREALGIWDREDTLSAPLASFWKQCEAPERPNSDRPVSFGVKFSLDGSHVALAAAQRVHDDLVFVDGLRVDSTASGIDWLVEFLSDSKRLSKTAQIVVEGKGGVGYLVDRLRASKVPGKVLITPTVENVVTAHSIFLESVKAQRLAHTGEATLAAQAAWATTRKIGNAGGFGWAAPEGQSVALLDAATMAHWAAATSKRKPRGTSSGRVLVM